MSENKSSAGDDSLIIVMFILLALVVFGWFFLPIFKEFFLTLKLWQLELIGLLIPDIANGELLNNLRTKPSYDWTFNEVASLGYSTNYYLLPLILLILYFTSVFVKKDLYLIKKYSKTYSPDSLLQQEKKLWRFLVPIADLNLLDQDPKVGPWASAKKPQEIVMDYKLLNNKKDLNSLNEEKAAKYFAMQLGNIYTNMDNLPIAYQALVGCFAAQCFSENEATYNALADISESASLKNKGNIDFSSGIKLFEKYKNEDLIIKIMGRHAYINTALARLFSESKKKGVIITKYFIWLKQYDRRLFYILNNVGREVAFVECAGIFDHYQHEVRLNRPMARVFVENAVSGLKLELKNIKLMETDFQ